MDDPPCSKRWRGLTLALLLFPSGALAQELGDSYLNLVEDTLPIVLAQDSSGAGEGESSTSSQIEAKREPRQAGAGGGPAVDASGGPASDPTDNVLGILRQQTQRQDDLRGSSERFLLLQQESAEKLNALRAAHAEQIGSMRFAHGAELRHAESSRLNDLAVLRAEKDQELRAAETKRIDDVRAVDVQAAQTDRERTVEQANVLAENVVTSAEKLASLVSSTEQSVASALAQSINALTSKIDQNNAELSSRITNLEQAQYASQGRQTLSDPQAAAMQATLDRLEAREASGSGRTEGSSDTLTWIFAGFGFLVTLIAGVGGIAAIVKSGRPQQPAPNGTRQNGNGGAYA